MDKDHGVWKQNIQPIFSRLPASDGARTGQTLLRCAMGGVFLAHGIQKLAVWGWTGGAEFFAQVGIPFPQVAAPLVAFVETAGGVLLLIGLGTRVTAGVLAFVMLVAAVTVHLPHGFFAPNGVELVLVLGVCLVVLAMGGGGPLALDNRGRAGDPGRDPTR